MSNLKSINPIFITWHRSNVALAVGKIKNTAAKMLASIGRSSRPDLKFDVLHSINMANIDPEAVTLLIASDTLNPPKFCTANKNISHVIQADWPHLIAIANIKTGRIKNYALAFGNSEEVAAQIAHTIGD